MATYAASGDKMRPSGGKGKMRIATSSAGRHTCARLHDGYINIRASLMAQLNLLALRVLADISAEDE